MAHVARPPPDPKLVQEALRLRREESLEDGAIAARLKIGARTVRRWRLAAERPAVPARAKTARKVPPRSVKGQRAQPPAPARPEPVPAELRGAAVDLWIIDQEIDATRAALAAARGADRTHGLAALSKQLTELLEKRAVLRPAEAPTGDEDERRWREDAAAVLRKITAGVSLAEQTA